MNMVMGHGYTFYGYEVLISALKGEDWQQSKFFPKVTNCYFKVGMGLSPPV